LQIFDAGTLTDAQGRKCDSREAVIILGETLVRVVDRMLGMPLAGALLNGKLRDGWGERCKKPGFLAGLTNRCGELNI
jgi:hypothetical protein